MIISLQYVVKSIICDNYQSLLLCTLKHIIACLKAASRYPTHTVRVQGRFII